MSAEPARTLKRRDVHPGPLVDGRPERGASGRLRRRVQRLAASAAEREEAALEQRIRTRPGVTRPNTIALISPKGGVGKTTSAFVLGNLLAGHLKLRAIAVDADPDFGTLARLAPDDRRSSRSLADLLDEADGLGTAAALNPYVTRLPTGLHLLGAPSDAHNVGPARYGDLVTFLGTFYEAVLLDLGTGVTGPLARFAIERADQVVLVATPEWVTSSIVLEALAHLRRERTTVAINKFRARPRDLHAVEERFRAQHLHRTVTIPYDEQLAAMLDGGTYALEALGRPTRVAVKRLGAAAAEQLV